MSDLQDLYQDMILDHYKNPRNNRKPDPTTHSAKGYNPLCGDKVEVAVQVDDENRITDVGFVGDGCAISKASASMLTTALKGKTVDEAERMFNGVHHMLTGEPMSDEEEANLGKLEVLSGVCQFPMRVKCATLAWHTFHNALHGKSEVSTE